MGRWGGGTVDGGTVDGGTVGRWHRKNVTTEEADIKELPTAAIPQLKQSKEGGDVSTGGAFLGIGCL